MSQDQNNKNQNTEEVDLIVFFNYIGDLFNKLIAFVNSIFKVLFSIFIGLFRTFFKSWKIVVSVILLALVLGYVAEKANPKVYSAKMLVEPYFDSKYQLVTNIEYYNALIASNNLTEIKSIFNIDQKTAESVIGFDISPGPETENDRKLQYVEFVKKVDSTSGVTFTYDDFIENRSIFSGRLFDISAYSRQDDIFPKLEGGITSAFTNEFSNNARKRRDTLLLIQKQNLKEQLKQIDSLQAIYIEVLQTESKKTNSKADFGGLSFSKEKQTTKEYDLFLKEQEIRDQLKAIDSQKVQEDEMYDVISSFQQVGNLVHPWSKRYLLIFPVLAFLLLCGFFFAKQFIQFTLNYEK